MTTVPRPPGPTSAPHEPLEWRTAAACHGEAGAVFYPPVQGEKRSAKRIREAQAKALCSRCEVRQPCLDEALRSGERYGIWGGLTDVERVELKAS